MILLDYGMVSTTTMFAQLGAHTNIEINIDELRHMILNVIRKINVDHRERFGAAILACDSKANWRKEFFPYYKANRKKTRDESELDWTTLHAYFAQIRDEILENMPYPVVHVEGAEADDIIAVLARNAIRSSDGEEVLIAGPDHDYAQLHRDPTVFQLTGMADKKVVTHYSDPEKRLFELIVKGDRGDGVPNIRSADNALVIGERQKPITQKFLDASFGKAPEEFCADETMLDRFKRNQRMVDFNFIPGDLQEKILDAYDAQKGKDRSNMRRYFAKNRLRNHLELIGDF